VSQFQAQATIRLSRRAIMDGWTSKTMLAELREERDGIEQAILVLERIASGRRKRSGPLANAVASSDSVFQPTQNCF
jgi:hypothetical protein